MLRCTFLQLERKQSFDNGLEKIPPLMAFCICVVRIWFGLCKCWNWILPLMRGINMAGWGLVVQWNSFLLQLNGATRKLAFHKLRASFAQSPNWRHDYHGRQDASRRHHGKNIPNPLKSCWCTPAQAHLKKMSKRARVRTPLGMRSCRPDVRSPAPARYRLDSKIQVHHWVSRTDWTKIIPRASLECRTWQHIDWVHEIGPLRRWAAFLLYICQTWSVPETKNKLFPGLRLKPWILPCQFDPLWTSRDGPQRLGRSLRVSNVVVQNASEKIHGSTGWWFQFCLFLILPSSESNWLVVSHIDWLVVSQITRPSGDFGFWDAPWVDTSQVQWAPCSAAAFAIEIEWGMLVSFKYPVLKCYLECYLETQDRPSVCVWARDSFICTVLSPARKQRCHTGRNHLCTATGDKGGQRLWCLWNCGQEFAVRDILWTSGPSQTRWKSWAWRSRNSCSHGAALHVSPAPALGESEAGSRPVRSGRVSLMDSLLLHITLFARDHWKYFRNAQNNAMSLFRLCNPGPQNVWRQRRLDSGCNLKHTRSKDILTALEQNTCRVVSMLCFNTMPKHLQNGPLKARFCSLRRTIIGRSGHFETTLSSGAKYGRSSPVTKRSAYSGVQKSLVSWYVLGGNVWM